MRRLRRPSADRLPTLVEIRAKYPLSARGEPDGAPDGKWNNPDVRGAVYAMGGRVCAYCQRLASDSRGDVEHFRPKAAYPFLKYNFRNYLLGCRICNSTRKSDKFPIAPRSRAVAFRRRMANDEQYLWRSLERERRLLLDPVDDPIEEWLDLDYENPLCPITVTMAAQHDAEGRRRVPETIDFFGLNIIPELVDERMKHVDGVLEALRSWRAGDESRAQELRKMANRYEPHGWATRNVLEKLASDLTLPTAEDDLETYVSDMLDRLDLTDLMLAKNLQGGDREMITRRKEELLWTLAVLWNDPPAGTRDLVEGWLAARSRRDEIKPFRDRITTELRS